jgi:hypothetical protein
MTDTLILKVGLHDVHKMGHLGEDKHPMAESLKLGQNPVDEFKFSRGTDDPLVIADVVIVFEEQVRVVTAFPQLHHQVCQGSFADLSGVRSKL